MSENSSSSSLRDSAGNPNWNAILKWSVDEGLRQEAELKAKGGGEMKEKAQTRRTISEEDRAWFLKAIESGVVDERFHIKMSEYTEEEVAKHDKGEDCWICVGNDKNGGSKVYDVTSYLDDHPGGREIIMEFAGKDADDMFEDIGHSSEARSMMKKYLKGSLKVDPDKPKKKQVSAVSDGKSSGLNPLAVIVLLIAVAAGIWFSQQN